METTIMGRLWEFLQVRLAASLFVFPFVGDSCGCLQTWGDVFVGGPFDLTGTVNHLMVLWVLFVVSR